MDDLNVIDRFMDAFIRYIDSGFGLLGGDVAFLTSVLIGIDITLAGLFWAMGGDNDVIAKLLKKILYVGVFAFIIGSFSTLADIIFQSFAGLGLTAGGGSISADDLLKPGRLASAGYEAAYPLLEQIDELLGPIDFFENFLTIMVLLIAWLIIILAFFILAVQLFITIIEFKLVSLAGFALVPFALWGRTAFLAERVLGSIVSARVQARNWRLMALGGLFLSAGLAGGLIWQSVQSRVTPYVVEVDRLGEARSVAPAMEAYRPTDPQIAWALGQFVRNVRGVSLDPVLMRENWLSAYDFASDRGALFLSEYARSADPFGQVGTRSVSVQIVSVVRASERSFQVKWSERVYERGSLVSSSRWTAMLTVAVRTPKSAEALRKNPLGLFVEAIDWSREYEAVEGAAAPSERLPMPAPTAPADEGSGIGAPLDIPTTTDQQRIIP